MSSPGNAAELRTAHSSIYIYIQAAQSCLSLVGSNLAYYLISILLSQRISQTMPARHEFDEYSFDIIEYILI